jgi:hypothetical protein
VAYTGADLGGRGRGVDRRRCRLRLGECGLPGADRARPAVGYYVLAGRDSDAGAVARREVDERVAGQRLRVQALVGRVLAPAVAIAYLMAVATNAMLWPSAVLLGVMAVSFLAGWLIYGEHGGGHGDNQADQAHRR